MMGMAAQAEGEDGLSRTSKSEDNRTSIELDVTNP